jgi:hypothetical protein
LSELLLNIEDFATQHPAMNSRLLVEHARVAFAKSHDSPAACRIECDSEQCRASVVFGSPEPTSKITLEREDFVEKGAIVMAGTLLHRFAGKQITRVTPRGSRVDYFVGEDPDDLRWVLEVGGTDAGHLETIRRTKHNQLAGSPYLRPPHSKSGYVGVTRFAPEAASVLDSVGPAC